jgi:hypothetical protein
MCFFLLGTVLNQKGSHIEAELDLREGIQLLGVGQVFAVS